MDKVFVILGQTATGKSNLAVKIALQLPSAQLRTSRSGQAKYGGEIISADSRQIYKDLDIGSGKITEKEMKGVPHHLLSIANPKRKFTVAQYKKLADKEIKEIIKRGKTPIICGGTGFYIDAITKGVVFPEVPPNTKLRKELDKKTSEELFKILKKLDSKRAQNIDTKNSVRLVRAIEIAKYLGKVPQLTEETPPYHFVKIGLFLPEDKLKNKVTKRVKGMFKAGLLNEIKKLKKNGISEKRLKEFGFEYFNPTEESVINETIKYAKRQMTWFKRDPEIRWFEASNKDQSEIMKLIK